jgi:hypothetical protein
MDETEDLSMLIFFLPLLIFFLTLCPFQYIPGETPREVCERSANGGRSTNALGVREEANDDDCASTQKKAYNSSHTDWRLGILWVEGGS